MGKSEIFSSHRKYEQKVIDSIASGIAFRRRTYHHPSVSDLSSRGNKTKIQAIKSTFFCYAVQKSHTCFESCQSYRRSINISLREQTRSANLNICQTLVLICFMSMLVCTVQYVRRVLCVESSTDLGPYNSGQIWKWSKSVKLFRSYGHFTAEFSSFRAINRERSKISPHSQQPWWNKQLCWPCQPLSKNLVTWWCNISMARKRGLFLSWLEV